MKTILLAFYAILTVFIEYKTGRFEKVEVKSNCLYLTLSSEGFLYKCENIDIPFRTDVKRYVIIKTKIVEIKN